VEGRGFGFPLTPTLNVYNVEVSRGRTRPSKKIILKTKEKVLFGALLIKIDFSLS